MDHHYLLNLQPEDAVLEQEGSIPWTSFHITNQSMISVNLMFVDPCIIVQLIQKNPTRCNSVSKFIIPHLYEAQHVSGDTPPIIRSLKLH